MEGANLVSLSLVTDLVNELVYGKVDAIVVDGAVAEQYAEANPDLAIAPASSELGEAQPYCIAVAKGDPKGLLPGINEAIAKMTSENKMEEFIAAAGELSGKAVEVTADAPAA
jgi:ABC-type amino acid transport substrate-binding protein